MPSSTLHSTSTRPAPKRSAIQPATRLAITVAQIARVLPASASARLTPRPCSKVGIISSVTTTAAVSSQVSSIASTTAPAWSRTTAFSGNSAASERRSRISANTGVSCSLRRRNIASRPNTPPAMKGRRHAHASTSASSNAALIARATNEPSRMPLHRPAESAPQAKARCRVDTCSVTNTHAPGASPPIAAPCMIRSTSNRIGASTPTVA